jgi:hypothetical protein
VAAHSPSAEVNEFDSFRLAAEPYGEFCEITELLPHIRAFESELPLVLGERTCRYFDVYNFEELQIFIKPGVRQKSQ